MGIRNKAIGGQQASMYILNAKETWKPRVFVYSLLFFFTLVRIWFIKYIQFHCMQLSAYNRNGNPF